MKTLMTTELTIPKLLQIARELPHTGYLETSSNYTYLNISDAYIHQLFPLLENEEIIKPDYFDKYSMGAHITVIYPEESKFPNPEDLGQKHDFQIIGAFSAEIDTKKYYALQVEAPSLLQLRKKYALTNMLAFKKHWIDFHITFAVSCK